MAGPHHNAVQDGKVGLLVPTFQVGQAVAQVTAHPCLEEQGTVETDEGSSEGGCKW